MAPDRRFQRLACSPPRLVKMRDGRTCLVPGTIRSSRKYFTNWLSLGVRGNLSSGLTPGGAHVGSSRRDDEQPRKAQQHLAIEPRPVGGRDFLTVGREELRARRRVQR